MLHKCPSLVLSTDASLRRCDGGGGIVFYAPDQGVILRAWYGIRMWVTPAGAEWLAHLVGLYLLNGWSGHLTTALDSTSALLRAHTRFPPKLTVLELLWRRLSPTLLRLRSHTELWVPAQHDSHSTHLLAILNRESHQLAARGAAAPTPWAVPLPHLLPDPLVLHYRGSMLVEPQLGLDAAYDATTTSAYFSGRRAHLLRPDGTIFHELLEADDIPTRAIKRALAYRVLESQPPPEPNIPMECHFCGTAEHQLWCHVRSRCPAAFLHLRRAQALLLPAATPTPAATVTGDGHLLDGQGRPVLSCTWDSHFTSEDAGMGDVLTLSGLWYASPDGGGAFLTAATGRRITKDVVSALAQPVLTPSDLLALWATLPYPHRTPDQPPPQPPTVSVLDHQSYLPWDYSLVTAYLVRGLPSWQVRCAAQLNISLPVEPQWHHGAPVLLIVAPPAALYWALALLAQAGVPPLWAGVALLTAVPPGDSTLALPQLMTPYACGTLWVYTTAGVSHRWALVPAAATQ